MKNVSISLTRIIHTFSFVQIQGIAIRRHISIFQGLRNAVDAQR